MSNSSPRPKPFLDRSKSKKKVVMPGHIFLALCYFSDKPFETILGISVISFSSVFQVCQKFCRSKISP